MHIYIYAYIHIWWTGEFLFLKISYPVARFESLSAQRMKEITDGGPCDISNFCNLKIQSMGVTRDGTKLIAQGNV